MMNKEARIRTLSFEEVCRCVFVPPHFSQSLTHLESSTEVALKYINVQSQDITHALLIDTTFKVK